MYKTRINTKMTKRENAIYNKNIVAKKIADLMDKAYSLKSDYLKLKSEIKNGQHDDQIEAATAWLNTLKNDAIECYEKAEKLK